MTTPTNYYHYNRPIAQQPTPKPKKRRQLHLVFGTLALLAILYGFHLLGWLPSPHAKAETKTARPQVLSASQTNTMSTAINMVINDHPDMDIGVAIEDLNNDQRYHYGISDPFIAASISKVLTAALFLHEVELSQQSLSENVDGYTAQYELQQLIEVSDDTAWQNLNDLLTHDGLLAYAQQIGLQNYDPSQNTLTVDDISVLLAKLYKGELLNSKDTNLLMAYMHDANYDNWIVANVPAGVKIFHKVGFLEDRVHDAAIIDNGKHPYVLVIFTKMDDGSDYDTAEGQVIFADITHATTQVFL